MDIFKQYPEIEKFVDKSDDYVNRATEFLVRKDRYLVVTQEGPIDGGQILFKATQEGWEPVDADTNVDVLENSLVLSPPAASGMCGASSNGDHSLTHNFIRDQVDVFSTANGPDSGNLACVWAVRHLAKKAIDRWITRTDGTAVFDAELQQCYGSTLEEHQVPAGGIIISPTVTRSDGTRNIGHVGLMGPGGIGLDRLIYSNSSGAKKWKQNFTLGSWIERYRNEKRLKVRFYPLPLQQTPSS